MKGSKQETWNEIRCDSNDKVKPKVPIPQTISPNYYSNSLICIKLMMETPLQQTFSWSCLENNDDINPSINYTHKYNLFPLNCKTQIVPQIVTYPSLWHQKRVKQLYEICTLKQRIKHIHLFERIKTRIHKTSSQHSYNDHQFYKQTKNWNRKIGLHGLFPLHPRTRLQKLVCR